MTCSLTLSVDNNIFMSVELCINIELKTSEIYIITKVTESFNIWLPFRFTYIIFYAAKIMNHNYFRDNIV